MNILKRLGTAAILVPVAFVSVQYFPRAGFFMIVQVIMLAALIEFYNLPRKKMIFPQKIIGMVLAVIIGASFYFRSFPLNLALYSCLLLLGVYYLLHVNRIEKLAQFPSSIALTFFGAVYLSFTFNHLNLLRDDFGPFFIYFMMGVIFIGDTGAFLIGKLWGKRKCVPMASPKKTWEGCWGGLLTACLTGMLIQQLLLPDAISLEIATLYAFLVHVVAQISDPIESLFKRASGVKDSSNLLPGHGGFFDRIDSLIFATPFFYYLLKYFGTSLGG